MKRYIFYSFLLAFLISSSSCDYYKTRDNLLTPEAFLQEVSDDRRFLSVEELAESLINEDPSIHIIDVRGFDEYQSFSLPGAINVSLREMIEDKEKLISDCDKYKTVFYANDDLLADQAWAINRMNGCKNGYVLDGGLNSWVDRILQPEEPSDAESADVVELYQLRVAMKNHFLGLSQELELEPFVNPTPRKTIVVQPKPKKVVEKEEEGC